MGQYWQWTCPESGETVSTHEFGSGLKYLEQWFSGPLYTAIMVLMTDTTSLGHGGGDFHIENAPEPLKVLIKPILGRWAGKRVVFAGDYTENDEHKQIDENGEERFTDISEKVATAV